MKNVVKAIPTFSLPKSNPTSFLVPFRLSMHDEGGTGGAGGESGAGGTGGSSGGSGGEAGTGGTGGTGGATSYTEEQLQAKLDEQKKQLEAAFDSKISQKFAEWEKKKKKAVEEATEAERLKNMTEEEKNAERMANLEKEVEEYKAERAKEQMMAQARQILQEKGVNVGDKMIANLIANDAETTKANVEQFIELYNKEVGEQVKKAMQKDSPGAGNGSGTLTKEDIAKVKDRKERQRLIRENAHLFQ